ncbi:MAG: penicillin-binding protein 2 [Rhodospirillales bacterium]|nr:penicillin-binding protein 2 [Rhodospirillales bacterium]
MQRENERQKVFSRRAAILGGGKLVLLSALVGRMYYLQVVESERYATLADENRINLRLLPPPRGHIVDRFGREMAVNQQNYRAVLISERTEDAETTLDALSNIIPVGEADRRRILKEIRRKRGFVPITIRENLRWKDVARIEVNIPDLPGVMIDEGQSRYYPYGRETAHVLGYVAAVSENETAGDPLLDLPGFRIGKAGIEKVHDLALRGASGSSQVEVNALGRVIRELNRQEGQPGSEITLTIDLELQRMASDRMGENSGAAVVVDIHTGDVLAMASTPAFDPNSFNNGMSAEEWKGLISNEKSPLTNKAVNGQYSPGSTYKMAVALAALEKGVITPETTFFCSGSVRLGNAEFHCWKKGGHGTVDLKRGIAESCDVYFYETAKRTGIDRIAEMSHKLGLGRPLGLDYPKEHSGLIPDRAWKKKTTGVAWQQGETLVAGIGQGYVLATPMQLAIMTARLANGGYAVVPHLTGAIRADVSAQDAPPGRPNSIGVPPEHLNAVLEAMSDVVNSPRGTARGSRIKEPGFEMGGKTGTVQVRRITKAEREQGVRKNEDLPWKFRDHAIFVGFAPISAPRYAVAVVVEHGGGGSKVAAPIAGDILLEAQRLNAAQPGRTRQVSDAAKGPADNG